MTRQYLADSKWSVEREGPDVYLCDPSFIRIAMTDADGYFMVFDREYAENGIPTDVLLAFLTRYFRVFED